MSSEHPIYQELRELVEIFVQKDARIAELEAENARLRAALQPFAMYFTNPSMAHMVNLQVPSEYLSNAAKALNNE